MNLTLYTERLRLAPYTDADLDLAVEMFTDPDVVEYVCDLMTEAQIRQEMPNWIKRGGNGCIGIWCVADRVTEEKLGSALLLPVPIEEEDTNYDHVMPGVMPEGDVEIGYALKRSAWGKGYATEACRRLVQFAFSETSLKKILATFYEENTESIHVLAKVGFSDQGQMFCYGEESPFCRITRHEWIEKQAID